MYELLCLCGYTCFSCFAFPLILLFPVYFCFILLCFICFIISLLMTVCFLMKERKGVDLDERGGRVRSWRGWGTRNCSQNILHEKSMFQ